MFAVRRRFAYAYQPRLVFSDKCRPVVCGHINGRGTVCVVCRGIFVVCLVENCILSRRQTSSAHARHETRQGKARHRQIAEQVKRRKGKGEGKEEQQSTGNLVWQFELSLPV